MIHLLSGKRRKLQLIKEEMFEQELQEEKSPQEEQLLLIKKFNKQQEQQEDGQDDDDDGTRRSDEELVKKRQEYLDSLQEVLIELDGITRTTYFLKTSSYLSLQSCSRQPTSLHNPSSSSSSQSTTTRRRSLVTSRQEDLDNCFNILTKGLVDCEEVCQERHLYSHDCYQLRRLWKLRLLSQVTTTTRSDYVVKRIGKYDLIGIDCSYSLTQDVVVPLHIGCNGVTTTRVKKDDLSTLMLSLQYYDQSCGGWCTIGCSDSYSLIASLRERRRHKNNDVVVDQETATTTTISDYCYDVQHDHFCRQLFHVMLSEAQHIESNFFIISGEVDRSQDSSMINEHLKETFSVDTTFFDHVKVVDMTRRSFTLSLSSTTRVTISLSKMNQQDVVGQFLSHQHLVQDYNKCLSECLLVLERLLISRLDKSHQEGYHSSTRSLKSSFISRFRSLIDEQQDVVADQNRSFLKTLQEVIQIRVWCLRVQSMMLTYVKRNDVRGDWIQQNVNDVLRGVDINNMVLVKTNKNKKSASSNMLILRVHASYVDVEDIGSDSIIRKFNKEVMLIKYVEKWLQ